MGPAPLLLLGGQPIVMLFVSVHPIVLFHLIFVPLSSCFFFLSLFVAFVVLSAFLA